MSAPETVTTGSEVAPARITASDLAVRRGDRLVLHGLDVTLPAGAWVAVLGPNGAGKTTLLQAVMGQVALERGEVRLDADGATSLSVQERARRLALVPQAPVVPFGMRLVDYVMLGRTAYMGRFATERAADVVAVSDALDLLDLGAFAERPLTTLSGGERQRAFLARAVAQAAPTLLLDEPTTALDPGRAQQVLDLVDRLRAERGLAVLSTLHDLTLAAQYADALVLLDEGRVVARGTADEVLTEPIIARHFGAHVRVTGSGRDRVVTPVRAS